MSVAASTTADAAPIPVTCVTGFLGAGKTTTILGLLKQLPKEYKVVLLKNEYGDVEVDSLLASQSQITGVSEILNGCLCCTMVGLVENALLEIKEKFRPDRIIIESSGSAFPATLALQIRQLEPQGFKLDGVVTVIDCINFKGYEDNSPSAKLQAKYTDLLLLSKHQLCSPRELDLLSDALGELNEDTPRIHVSPDRPVPPEVLFGLDTKLFMRSGGEKAEWESLGGRQGPEAGEGWHGDEVEVRGVWSGGRVGKRGEGGSRQGDGHRHGHIHEHGRENGRPPHAHSHAHEEEADCACEHDEGVDEGEDDQLEVFPISRELLETELGKLNFEIYRVKGIVRLANPHFSALTASSALDSASDLASPKPKAYSTHLLNWAFGRFELTPMPSLDKDAGLRGVGMRLTVMGERGEVARRAKRFADGLGARCD